MNRYYKTLEINQPKISYFHKRSEKNTIFNKIEDMKNKKSELILKIQKNLFNLLMSYAHYIKVIKGSFDSYILNTHGDKKNIVLMAIKKTNRVKILYEF